MVTMARLSETLVQYLADPDAHSKADILFEHAAHFFFSFARASH
jgi:hypothetical protein